MFIAWDKFKADKKHKKGVSEYEQNLEQNIFALHRELRDQTYRHDRYESFWIRDPKLRNINKATVRDRVLHHAVYQVLNSIFEPTFIPASYSCRVGKGTHKAVGKLTTILRRESRNNAHQCWVLKCDIKKFFDSIDHDILVGLLQKKIKDEKAVWLLEDLIESYTVSSNRERERERVEKARRSVISPASFSLISI
ncbi:MAG: reverse transcriptase domain-containing protein [Candidatus Paceibacterota bacterium]